MLDPTGKLKISDTTLRDGEQAPGVVFRLRDKLRIAALLNRLGVAEVEIGSPALGRREVRECRILAGQGFSFDTGVWCRAHRDDLIAALQCEVEIINISFPVSDILLEALGHDRVYLMFLLDEILTFADRECPRYSVGLQDAGRSSPEFLDAVIRRVAASRAFRVRLADTIGILNPMSVAGLIGKTTAQTPTLQLEFHGHNDLGMALANTVSAAQAGAHYLSVTVNGLGERSGNCPLEELLFALKYSCGFPLAWDSAALLELCKLTAEISHRPPPPGKPITGAMALRHESGIHVRCLLHDPLAYSPFPPGSLVGRGHEFVIGKHSGLAAVNAFFQARDIILTVTAGRKLLSGIKRAAARLRRGLSEAELLELYHRNTVAIDTKE